MVVELKELFLRNYGAWRVVSQWLWKLKSRFSTFIDLEKLFHDSGKDW
jgi:hypothetical protein